MEPIQYKGFTIEEDLVNPYSKTSQFMFYPTKSGANHDYDISGDGYKYSGNCQWADTMEDAVEMIDDLVAEQKFDSALKIADETVKKFTNF